MKPEYLWKEDPERWAGPLEQAAKQEEALRKKLIREVRNIARGWINVLKSERLEADACLGVALQAVAAAAAAGDMNQVARISETSTLLAHSIVDRSMLERRDYAARFGQKDSGEVIP